MEDQRLFSERETKTIHEALRSYQRYMIKHPEEFDYAEELDAEELDGLCERVNFL